MKKPVAPEKTVFHKLFLQSGWDCENEPELYFTKSGYCAPEPLSINVNHLVKLIQNNISEADQESITIQTECKQGVLDYWGNPTKEYITYLSYTHTMTDSELEGAETQYAQEMDKWKQAQKAKPPRKKPLTKKQKLEKQLNEIKEELNKLERKKK